MNLADIYADRYYKSGETVYHKPSGAVGKVSKFYHEMDTTGWTGSLVDKVCVEIVGIDNPYYFDKKELTHTIPRYAKYKHLYDHCPRYIYLRIYLLGGIMLVACAMTGQLYFDIPAFISFLILIPGVLSSRKKSWVYTHTGVILLYGIYLLILTLLAVGYHITK